MLCRVRGSCPILPLLAYKTQLQTYFYPNCSWCQAPLNDGNLHNDPTKYRQLVGSLQHLTLTYPNITYIVQQICQFMHAPYDIHVQAAKCLLRYLKGNWQCWFWIIHFSFIHNGFILLCRFEMGWVPLYWDSRMGRCIFFGSNPISWSNMKKKNIIYLQEISLATLNLL